MALSDAEVAGHETNGALGMNPEDRTKTGLTSWLEDHGATVWWEKDNPAGYDTFTIEEVSTVSRPDLLVEVGSRTYAVEVKIGWSKSDVYDAATQLVGYWERYARDDETYTADGETREVTDFVTATKTSPMGRLFNESNDTLLDTDEYSNGRHRAIDQKRLPPLEYMMTEQHIRMMWRFAKTTGVESDVRLGGLLSTRLERTANHIEKNGLPTSEPAPASLTKTESGGSDWCTHRGVGL